MKTTSYLDFQSVCNGSKRQNEHSRRQAGDRTDHATTQVMEKVVIQVPGPGPGAHEVIFGGRQM